MIKTVWFDILTPKQAMLLGSIALRLAGLGMNTVITSRNYDYTQAVLKNIGLNAIAIGGYSGSLLGKLLEEVNRMKGILEVVGDRFDLAVAYPNPVAARIAFGLGKYYIALTDSPHSEIVSRLSLPLARYVVVSRCIPLEAIERYIYKEKTEVVQYNGVDEAEWLKDFVPNKVYVESLGLEPFGYAVARPPEVKASYYRYEYGRILELFRQILGKILSLGLKLVYLPRYEDDPFMGYLKQHKDVVIPPVELGIIGHQVVYYASLVVTGGGTLAREAALVGTPGVSLFPEELYVDRCLVEQGLPLLRCRSMVEFENVLAKYTRDPERFKTHAYSVLKGFERPSDVLVKIINEDIPYERKPSGRSR